VKVKKELFPPVNTQTKLLSAMDYNENVLRLEILQSKVPKPRVAEDYEVTEVKVPLGNIQPGDMCELHKQTNEMMYRGVFQASASKRKIKELNRKMERKLKHEKTTVREKAIQITDLQKKITTLSVDPHNPKVIEELLSQKDNEINILKEEAQHPISATCTNSQTPSHSRGKEEMYQSLV
jgi:hypothetical protein